MSQLVEPKAQRWRAVIIFRDGTEALLYIGSNHAEVKSNYTEPWFELYDHEQHSRAKEIRLQKWNGLPDRGSWVDQKENLPVPAPIQLFSA